jgi:hypothetical protein
MKADILSHAELGYAESLASPRSASRKSRGAGDLKFIFGVCVVAFFVVACVGRLSRRHLLPTEPGRLSLLAEAKSAAAMVVEFVAMS